MVQQKIPPVSPSPASSTRPPAPPSSSSSSSALAGKAPMPNGARKPGQPRRSNVVASIPFWLGLLVSIMWVGVVILIVARSGPARTLAGLPLVDWAIGISSIASPVALIWMVTAYLQRAADIQAVAEPLRRQLSLITGESGLAETRVRRFNQAIREQLELLKAAKTSGQDDLGAIVDRIQKQRVELERFEQTSIAQVKDIQDIIRRNMQQVEHVMDDKFTQMRVLDDKLVQSGDTISRQTENMRKETAKLLQEIEANNKQLAEALDRAMTDSKRLSETTKIQETSLTTAATSAAEILGGVSSKIDLSVARFLERAGSAREEAERLASALETQTRSLDEFSNTLPARVKDAEVVLRGVAERLHSSEKGAREQTINLSETLGKRLEGLQGFLDGFTDKMMNIDGSLEKRRVDFDALAERVLASAATFSGDWEKSVTKLSDSANDTMIRFAAINDETGKSAASASMHLGETIEKYEDTIRRLHATTDASSGEFRAMTEQIASHLSQFDALRDASHKAGEEVEIRASSAMENLKVVLDRLLTARDATGAVGEKLVKDLYTAVDQNESLISRLKEAAQAGVVALSTASENLAQQNDGILDQTKDGQQQLQAAVAEIQKKADEAVADLRAQTASLTSLLAEAQIQMEATDKKMQSFVVASLPPVQEVIRQIDQTAEEGVERASRFGDKLQDTLKAFIANALPPIRDAVAQIDNAASAGLDSATRYGAELQQKLKALTADSLTPLEEAATQINTATSAGLESATRYGVELQQKLRAITLDSLLPLEEAVAQIDSATSDGLASATRYGVELQQKLRSITSDSLHPLEEAVAQIDSATSDGLASATRYGAELQQKLKALTADSLHPLKDVVAQIDNATAAGLASATRYGSELQNKLQDIASISINPVEGLVRQINEIANEGLQSTARYSEELQGKLSALTGESINSVQQAARQINQIASEGLQSTERYSEELQGKLNALTGESINSVQQAARQINQIASEGLQSTARYGEELQQKFSVITGSSINSVTEAARKIDEITTSGLSSATRYGENLQQKVENMASASLKPIEAAVSQIDLTTETGLQSLIKYGADLQQKLETIAAAALKPVEETGQKIDEASANRLQMAVRYGEELQEKLRSIAASALIPVQDAVRQIDQTAETGLRSVGRYGSELQTRLQNITSSSLAPITEAITKIDNATETSLSSLSRYGEELQGKLQGIAASSLVPVNDVVRQIDQAAAAGLQSASRYGEELQEKLKAIATASLAPVEEAARQVDASATAGLQSIARYGSELQDKLQDIATASVLPMRDVAKQIDQAASAGLQSVDRYSDTLESKLKHFIDATLPPVQAAVQKVDEAATSGMQSISRYGDDLRTKLNDIAGTSLAPIENVVKQIDEATNAGLESTARFGEDLQNKLKTLAAAALAPIADTIRTIDSTASVGLQSATRYGEELQTKLKSLASNALLPVVDTIKKMDQSADTGLKTISKYGEGLTEQLNQLQGFNDRVSGMGAELSKVTLDTVGEIEKMQGRFAEARTAQEETAKQTLAQFADIAERLGREVAGLDGQSFKAVASLQEAASRVGEQSYQMLQNAETSSAKMQLVTTALQSEASKIHNILQKQTDDFSAGITRAEKQFAELGDALSLRTDATYSLLDRIAAHYNETTNAAATELDNRAMRLESTAMQAAGKMDGLSATINQHLTLITAGSAQLETQAGHLASAGSKALSQLSAVNEKLSIAHEAANNNAQQTINKLEECNTAFLRQTNNLSEAATSSIANIQKASVTFGEQVTRASDANRVIEQTMRQLTSTATTLAEQSSHIRSSMDQQSQQLITRLTEAVTQMDANNTKLEQLSDKATSVTDKATASFGEMTQNAGQRIAEFTTTAGQRLGASRDQMHEISTKAEIALAALGTNITQQASSLSTLSEQLVEQQRVMAAANESQRTQLIDLFDKLGSAHSLASDVAERTIVQLSEALIQVQKQLGALSDQSQESVGNVRAAGAGFAEESASLLQNAQAAEAQARTVLSVTSALQDQARQLREALNGEGERAGDMLGALLSKLNAGGLQLRDLTSNAELMLTGLNSSLIKETDTLTSSMQQISERQRGLTVSLDAQRDVMNGLISKLIEAQGDTATASEVAVARMNESAKQVVKQAEDIDAQARAAVTTLQNASGGFIKESATLTSHAQEAEQQVRGILTATVSLQEEARRMRETLDAEGARANEVLSGLSNKMAQGTDQVRALSATAEDALASLGTSVSEKTESLSNSMQQISERQRVLTSSLEAQREVLNGLLSRLAQAQDETAMAAERTASRMTDSAQSMSGHIGAIDQQSKIALSSITAANAGFASEAEALINRATEAEEKMRNALNATIALQEQTRQMREALDTDGARTSEILTHLLERITSGSVQMRDAGNAAEGTLSGLGGAVRHQTDVLNAAMEQIAERQRTLGSALDSQRDDLNNLLGRLVLAQDETATVAERTATRLAESALIVTTQVEAIDTQSRSALESIQAANSGFNQESALLASHSQQAEQQARAVLSVTATLQEQAKKMREALSGESERAAAALTVLLDQLALSGTRVQDIASNAGISLETLQGGINRQGTEVETVLAEVIRRQETLTSAMTEQREMIGALLDRMTQAQDEAARVGERTAERLASGTQEIAKQLEVMGSQAQSTLATVQSAGQGFANEAQTLRTHADAAEEKVRGILLAMGGLEEEGRKLRDAIHAEAGRVIAEMSGVIAQLDEANVNLKQQSGSTIDVMSTSAAQFTAISIQGTETMRQQAAALQDAADASTARMASAGEIIKAQFNLVGDAGKEAEANAERLAATATKAADSMASLRHSVAEGDREGQNVVEQAAYRIEAVKATLQGELQRMADVSQQAVLSVAAASQQLTSQSDILRANLSSSESALINAADLVREETTQLPALLNRSTSQIEAAAKALKNQAGDTDTVLVGTADRFIAVTAIARESMVDEIRHVSSVADEADKILRQFTTTLTQQVTSMQESATVLSEEQKQIVAKSGESVAQITAASNRLAQLRNDAAATAEKLAREFDALDVRVTATGTRLEKAGETATKSMDALADLTQKAETTVLSATSGFRDQFERIRQGLQTQIDDLNRGLMQITAQLERTGSTLRSTTAGTVADVERISQRFNDTSKEAGSQLTEKTARMRSATEEVAKLLSGFGDQLDVLLDRLSVAGDGIKRHEGSLIGQLQSALQHLSGVAERLETSRTLATNVSEQAIGRLDEVAKSVHDQMRELTSGSQAAAGIMRGIGQIYGDQTQALHRSVGDAHAEVQAMNKSVDEMQQRTDRIRLSLKLQSDELMQGLSQILNQLSTTGDALSDTVDQVLSEQAADNLKKMG